MHARVDASRARASERDGFLERARARARAIASTLARETVETMIRNDDATRHANDDSLASRAPTRCARATEACETSMIPRLARAANGGAVGAYAAMEARDGDADDAAAPRAYVDARLARFDVDVRGYDADARAVRVFESDAGRRGTSVSGGSECGTAAAAAAGGRRRGDGARGGSATAGLGSRPLDASRAMDAYAAYRDARSSVYRDGGRGSGRGVG